MAVAEAVCAALNALVDNRDAWNRDAYESGRITLDQLEQRKHEPTRWRLGA